MQQTDKLKNFILHTLDEQKAINIVSIPLAYHQYLADCIIIATGTSGRHLLSMKDKICAEAKVRGFKILGTEGEEGANWVIIDLSDIIVHLFRAEVREYYKIEEIWAVQ